MGKVVAAITTSVDGYITGPDDGPELGLGLGGERLHYWVMGGPWTYGSEHERGADMTAEDRVFFDRMVANLGGALAAVACSRRPAGGAERTRLGDRCSWSPIAADGRPQPTRASPS